jgi:hypothetical protein
METLNRRNFMSTSSISAASATAAASSAGLTPSNVQFRGHGHKHGKPLESVTDPSSSAASQTPSGSTQNLFSTLLSSLEQVIGIQSPQLGQTSAQTAHSVQPSQSAQSATGVLAQASGSRINIKA